MLTGASGSTFTIPTAALLLGKTVVLKKAVLEGMCCYESKTIASLIMMIIPALFAKEALESMKEEPYHPVEMYPMN